MGQLSEELFLEVAGELGYDFTSVKMDVVTAQAMWEEANINTCSQQIIMRYLCGFFGKKVKVTDGNYDVVSHVTNYTKRDGESINFSNKPSVKMDVVTAQAMWEEANINTCLQQTIMRYLHGFFGKTCHIPTVKVEVTAPNNDF